MAEQHRLDLGRHHVLAAADDQLALAAGDEEKALVVDLAEVAGAQAAVVAEATRRRRSGPETTISPSSISTCVVNSGRPAEPSLRWASAGRQRRDLGGGLGHAVGLDDRRPGSVARSSRSTGSGPPPSRIARGLGDIGAGVEQARELRGDQGDEGDVVGRRATRRRGRRRSRRGSRRSSRRSPSAPGSRARRCETAAGSRASGRPARRRG